MRSSIVLASALATGAFAVPHAQLEDRALVTEVDWDLATATVYVTVDAEPAVTDVPEILESEDSSNKIAKLYQRPVRPVFSGGTWIWPTVTGVVANPPRPIYTPPRPVYTPPRPVYTPPVVVNPPVVNPPVIIPPVIKPPVVNPPVVGTPPAATQAPAPKPTTAIAPPASTPPVVNIPTTTPPTVPSVPVPQLGSHISGPSQASLSVGAEYQAAVLYHHNAARANHNAAPLVWNSTVAATAYEAAKTCNFQHYIPPGVRQGQNLFTVSGSAFNVTAGITESWYKGELGPMMGYFGKADIPDTVFHNVGHLTQMLWKSTTSVGCVSIDCGTKMIVGGKTSTMNKYTVCNYFPAGNVGTQYALNVGFPNSVSAAALGRWSD